MFDPLRKAERAAEALRPFLNRYRRATVFVFAPGPTLPRLWPPNIGLPPFPKIAISDAYKIVPDADILYSTDNKWWAHHRPSFAGLRVCYDACEVDGVIPLEGSGPEGYDDRLGYVRHGGNSGYAATHLAAQLGAARILLVGFDMRAVSRGIAKNGMPIEKHHFFGDHPVQCRNPTPNNYELWVVRFSQLARELATHGVDLLNATPGSALRLPYVDLETLAIAAA